MLALSPITPPVRFALRAIEAASVSKPASEFDDDAFFDALYATLTAWGLHRMGPGNTKLRDLDEIRDSIRAQANSLDELAGLNITAISEAETAAVVERVWAVVSALRVSVAKA